MYKKMNQILLILLAIAPAGLFIITGWISAVLFLGAFISILLIIKDRSDFVKFKNIFWGRLIVLMFCAPLLAGIFSQSLRGILLWPEFDSPSRFLLALPIFLVAYKYQFNLIKYWQLTLTLCLALTLIAYPFLPKYYQVDTGRLAIYFTDPLTLGHLTLTFGLLSLFSINLEARDKLFIIFIKVIGSFLGFYFSMKSESRTGWLAIPVVCFIFLWSHGPKNKMASTFFALFLSITISISAYELSSRVRSRIDVGIQDVISYKMYEENPLTSIGERISFARMGWYYFKLQPFAGWGRDGFKAHVNDPEISQYANEHTRNTPAGGLFHSEFTTNMVKFGIWGIIYTGLLFFVPLGLFIKLWRQGIHVRASAFGITYVLCEFIGGFSTEVFNLKFTATFYAIMIAGLCAFALNALENTSKKQESL